MSRRLLLTTAAALCLIAPGARAQGKAVDFIATLSGTSEVPPVQVPASGKLTAKLDPQSHQLTYTLTYANLSAPPTAAHFHGPASPGQNAGVQLPIEPPFSSPATGTVKLSEQQQADLQAGKWYVNVHTQAHPGGEIRGQVLKSGGM